MTTFKTPIPPGCQILVPGLSVQGLHVEPYRTEGEKFAGGREQELLLIPEPTNPHDKNAIRVVGKYKGMFRSHQAELGYIPRDVAEALAQTSLVSVVAVRLKDLWVGVSGRVEIGFDVIGPREHKKTLHAYLEKKASEAPMSDVQKEFAWFFGLKLPKGATFGQAQAQIDAHTSSLTGGSADALDDWDAYREICDELDDPETRKEAYSVKAISRKILRAAIDDLKREGMTLRQLADDPQLIVDRVIAAHPALERLE